MPANIPTVLERDVEQFISERTYGRIHKLRVELTKRAVVVHGRCRNYYSKQLALTAAQERLGVTDALPLELDIQVNPDWPR